jgi:hypothetical protein
MDIARMQLVIATLNKIEVCGKNNLSLLLGSINELELMLKAAMEKPQEGKGEKK